jgi:hypothetical protein
VGVVSRQQQQPVPTCTSSADAIEFAGRDEPCRDVPQAIFAPARSGERKVIVATNIAETSITVDDVTHVIDSGKMKETRYDSINGMSCLVETWVSKAGDWLRPWSADFCCVF